MIEQIVKFVWEQLADMTNPAAATIAQRSLPEIHARLDIIARDMSPAEVCGYVRARGRRVVNLHTRLVALQQGEISRAALELAKSRALKQATQEVVREVLSKPSARFNRRAA